MERSLGNPRSDAGSGAPHPDAHRAIQNPRRGPLLTLPLHQQLLDARAAGLASLDCSLDLGRSRDTVAPGAATWRWRETSFPYLPTCKERTIYWWDGAGFQPAARFGSSLIKLVPTEWDAPTFEIDGIKMLPTAQVSPYEDARRKVGLIEPRGKSILDTCGGLGYFAAWCLLGGASRVDSYEKNPDVIWLRSLNPWSPQVSASTDDDGVLTLTNADISERIALLDDESVDAVLHDPPRFGIAGELYSQAFYDHLVRVLRRGGRLFHYTGTPNRLTSGRDVPREVATRLQRAGLSTDRVGDGILAIKPARVRR